MKKEPSGKSCYKKGGKVKKEIKVSGEKNAPRLDKFARGGAAKKHHGKTQVNIMVGHGGAAAPTPMMPPMVAPPGAGGPPMMPPRPPGMKRGGAAKMKAGSGSGEGRLQKTDIQKGKS